MSASAFIPCLNKGPAKTEATLHWQLVVGTVQIFISGPGPDAWLACSKPNYEPGSKPGTESERYVARRALKICIQRHRDDRDAGVSEIKAAFKQAIAEIRAEQREAEAVPA